jgi:histidinol-phosphate/aromatic aminotransferase/cobyric acid decarboxylase-like protein
MNRVARTCPRRRITPGLAPAPRACRIAVASPADRERIYALRHQVYAMELGQHAPQTPGVLSDGLDAFNDYLVAWHGERLAGFISVTPPGGPAFSLDKYLSRDRWPFTPSGKAWEVRLLTLAEDTRGATLAGLLMYAAFRWIQAAGGEHVFAIGRREVAGMYAKAGLRRSGHTFTAGAVQYELMHAPVARLADRVAHAERLLRWLEARADWRLPMPFHCPAPCFHGGAFFADVGERFDALERRLEVINADVLDAWFPPAPAVLAALQNALEWLLRTSPPTHAAGLVEVIAETRGVAAENLLVGAGSSDLIFRALPCWLDRGSRALITAPTYSEYAHILERVIGCQVDRLVLREEDGFRLSSADLAAALEREYDLVVLVNPNSPTGHHLPRAELEAVLRATPPATRVWVDETYVDYVGAGQSLESYAAASRNVVVCKSMSKAYALSGARVGYLCAHARQLEALRSRTPPWVVGLPAQLAAVNALRSPEYYHARYAETHQLRASLAEGLRRLGWEVLPAAANFLLARLPADAPDAPAFLSCCRQRGLHLRDPSPGFPSLGQRYIRFAVKDAITNDRLLRLLVEAQSCPPVPSQLQP